MATRKTTPTKKNEIHIKEEASEPDGYFRRQADEGILTPELNITIRDGFRFGIGFILASLIFYVVAIIGVIIFVKVAPLLHLV